MSYRSIGVVSGELTLDDYRAIRTEAIRRLEEAIRNKGKKPEEYAIRELLPTDLGFSNDVWEYDYSAATTEENIVNMTVGDDTFIAIFAIINLSTSPLTTRLTFYKGTIVLKKIGMEDAYAEEVPKKVLDEPLVWSESDTLRIVGYASAAGTDKIVFKGYIAEPLGKTVGVTKTS